MVYTFQVTNRTKTKNEFLYSFGFSYDFYKDFFDRDVYDELLRIQRTLEYSLNDYFLYQFKKRSLNNIIAELFK